MTDARTELAAIVERVDATDPYLACGVGRDEDDRPWLTPAALGSSDGSLDRLAASYGARWGVPDDRCSQASYIVLDLSWYAFAPLVAALLVTGSLPRLDGASLALDPETRLGRLALAPHRPHRSAAVADLRDEISGWMEPIIQAIVDRRWLGRKPAWWGVGDRVVGAFEYLGDLLDDPVRARELASALVHDPGSMLDSPRHRFQTLEHLGMARTVGLRAACCRFYRVPGGEKCTTCPLLPEAERVTRIHEEIEASLATAAPV